MGIIDWTDEQLCEDSDLVKYETNVLEWTEVAGDARKWRDSAKELIEQRLRHALRTVELATDADDVLDLIADVAPLKIAASYMTLHLLCNDCSTGGDHWAEKASMYYSKFEDEWPRAVGLLSLDTDEDDLITDSEKYNVDTGATFSRGY